eukprot:3127828-Prorocentrum_lima.AAC.1
MEIHMIEVYRALGTIGTELDANERGLEYVIDQVDQLEQNLQLNVPTQPIPLPPPVTPQPPTPQPGPGSPGAQVDPGQLQQM